MHLVKKEGAIRKIAVFLDGTWNTPESRTNVYKLYQQTEGIDARRFDIRKEEFQHHSQIKYYDPGVGTGAFDAFSGGAFGRGLKKNILQAYEFLCRHHKPGDEVYVFGFSRGAFSARSLVGLIDAVGLLEEEHLSKPILQAAYKAYKLHNREISPLQKKHARQTNEAKEDSLERYKKSKKKSQTLFRDKWSRKVSDENCTIHSETVRIKFLGVWDTVGALGIPDSLANLFFITKQDHQMANQHMCSNVDYAYHALAIDEHRYDYQAVLWDKIDPENIEVAQVWFPGAHANIGGGQRDNKLNELALQWMRERAEQPGGYLHSVCPELAPQKTIENEHGLAFYTVTENTSSDLILEPISDSYRLFLSGLLGKLARINKFFYRLFIHKAPPRGKLDRHYRTIKNQDPTTCQCLHSSVRSYLSQHPEYRPRNLVEQKRAASVHYYRAQPDNSDGN